VPENVKNALIVAVVGVIAILVLRFVLRRLIDHYLERIARKRRPDEVAGARTRLIVSSRVVVVLVAMIVAWQVAAQFPATQALGHALLASSAVLALLVGLALTTPLANLGSGLLLAFTQPVRLGDRITVADVTGVAQEINLIHTVLLTDDDRRVFIPNQQMVSSIVVNRTIEDPRRSIVIRLPVRLGTKIDEARAAVLAGVHADSDTSTLEDVGIALTEIEASLAWLTLTVYAPARSQASCARSRSPRSSATGISPARDAAAPARASRARPGRGRRPPCRHAPPPPGTRTVPGRRPGGSRERCAPRRRPRAGRT
jgi:small conductance mechanosensitive channel